MSKVKEPHNEGQKESHFYGGQAVMEGVMMRGKALYSLAVRKPDGEIMVSTKALSNYAERFPILKLPVIRGIAAFVSSLSLGMKTLTQSAEIAAEGIEEEPTSFEKFLERKFGSGKANDILIKFSIVVAVGLAMLMFIMLPLWLGGGLFSLLPITDTRLLGVFEGIVRLCIFVTYVVIVSRSRDIRRVFEYHGAEHKTINCYENGAPLTVEEVSGYSRLHNRCGTSFLLIVMFISILVFAFVRTPYPLLRLGSRIVLIPVIAGLSYEVIRWAGKHDNFLVRIISFPGLLLQRLTTGEPDEQQMETAIVALQAVLNAEKGEMPLNEAEDEAENEAETEGQEAHDP